MAALMIIFIVLAFSDDLIRFIADARHGGQYGADRSILLPLIVCDTVLLGLAYLLGWCASRSNAGWSVGWVRYVFAAAGTIGLDIVDELVISPWKNRLAMVATSLLFVALLCFAASALVRPSKTKTPLPEEPRPARLMLLAALTGGTCAAYLGANAWDAIIGAGKQAADKEYFAQITQVIPLILIALVSVHLRRIAQYAAGRAITASIVLILGFGELLALSVLPVSSAEGGGQQAMDCKLRSREGSTLVLECIPPDIVTPDLLMESMMGWHQYLAFIFSLQAAGVALVMLVWTMTAEISMKVDQDERARVIATPSHTITVLRRRRRDVEV